MNCRIKKMESFYVTGKSTQVTSLNEQSFKDIPLFWDKCCKDGILEKLEKLSEQNKQGIFSGATVAVLCYKETDTKEKWSYLIGAEGKEELSEMETIKIPSLTWAIFESVGPMPNAIQKVWKHIFSEWFPSSNYEHDKAPELEVYSSGDTNSHDYCCEVWIPIVQKK